MKRRSFFAKFAGLLAGVPFVGKLAPVRTDPICTPTIPTVATTTGADMSVIKISYWSNGEWVTNDYKSWLWKQCEEAEEFDPAELVTDYPDLRA